MSTLSYDPVGYMPMPAGFPFKRLFDRGRPQHDRYDPFRIRHPQMPAGRRAKIFAPFDALAGFDEAIASKNVLYEPKRRLSESEKQRLDQKIRHLSLLAANGGAVRRNRPTAAVTYFVPCPDENNFAYGTEGTYDTITGIVQRVDAFTMTISGECISLEDISDISMDPPLSP